MMQSVGEVMAIGRTFPESLQKALRSLETGRVGLNADPTEREYDAVDTDELVRMVASPTPDAPSCSRPRCVAACPSSASTRPPASTRGSSTISRSSRATCARARHEPDDLSRASGGAAKRLGFADAQLGYLWGVPEDDVRAARLAAGVHVTYKTVDTCAAEFAASTPYHYGTYEDEDEVAAARPAARW